METCRWCTASPENDAAVAEVLQRYCTGEMTPKEMHDANSDFIYCLECVVRYHQAREEVNPSLHKRLWDLETARLLEVFREMLAADLEDDDLYFVNNGQEQRVSKFTPEEFHNRLRFSLVEVLKYPYLLCHKELCEMVVNVLCKMEDMKNPLPVHDQYQGTYMLMVHPNEMVRRWAIATARSLGRVDRDNFYDLQEVFSCMFYIIDLGITVDDFISMNDSYCSGKLQILPPHLYDSKNKKSYWLGICMLLMQLDSQAMDSLLMGPEGQASIPQCIINTMNDCNKDDDLDPFWPSFHCFLVILDRLGSKIWGQIEPLDAFQAITKAGSYIDKIEDIRLKTAWNRVKAEPENHEDLLSCSQMVYDCYTTERTNRSLDCSSGISDTSGNAIFEEMSCLVNVLQSEMGQDMRVYGSTFLWFIPFVRSLMELTVLNSICIGEVIHYLDNNVNKDVLFGRTQTCDKVTEFFIRILVDIIELHLSKSCMERLSYFSHIWVDIIIQCATLPDDLCHSNNQDRKGVYSTAHFGRGQMPLMGVGAMSTACMKLIRSLLKEGGRTGTVPESAHFLDLINRHMRGFSSRGWNLPKLEYENLKKCLLRLIKVTAEKPPVSNCVLPCAPPTPPSDPPENVILHPNSTLTPPLQNIEIRDAAVGPISPINFKAEPVWDREEGLRFCDGREEMIKIKKEPYNPIQTSEYKPSLKEMRIIPEKIQEIRSRLADKNYSGIRVIAKGLIKTEDEHDQCTDLTETGHASIVSPQPSTSQSALPDSTRLSTSFKKEFFDDDEPLNVVKHRLQKSLGSGENVSTDARQVLIQSVNAKEVKESNVITISDDEVSSNEKPLLENREIHVHCLTLDLTLSPERDYDDLSESQVFEFETQASMASAWNELTAQTTGSDTDCTDVNKKPKVVNDSKACVSDESVEPMQTQSVTDEDIENACLQAEAQISKQQQPREPVAVSSSMEMPPKPTSTEYIQSKHLKSPTEKTGPPEKKGKQLLRKPPVIAALNNKTRKRCKSIDPICQETVKQSSSTTPPSKCSSVSSLAEPLRSTPAIVPPKKVRKRTEPECPTEFLGLKKKERKAFEFSQRSLDSLDALRSHGQHVHVESKQKSKQLQKQNVGKKKGKKLLASQDLQYFRQSRTMLQKPAVATPVAKSNQCPVPETIPKFKPAVETVKAPEEEEDDYTFLPCSQPDPDQRLDNRMGTGQANTSISNDPKEAVRDCGTFDDEWTCLTQNEPTDMELCSQVEQMEEEYGENLTAGSVHMHNDPGNQPSTSEAGMSVPLQTPSCNTPQKAAVDSSPSTTSNDRLFLKPSIPTACPKKAKPSTTKIYTASSRNASLAKEMEKVPNPAAKVKVVRPPPAMPPPPPPKSTPQHEFCQPPPSRSTLNSPNPVSKSPISNLKSACHVPSYKTYARPEAPVPVRTPTVDPNRRFDQSQMFDQSYLKRAILKWEFCMFENYKMFGTPKDLCPLPLKDVPTTFSGYTEYFNTFYPLMLINTFEEMVSEWLNGCKISILLNVQRFDYSDRIATATFTASLNPAQERGQLYPKDEDLVLLWLPENTGAYSNDEPNLPERSPHFGCVLRSNVLSNGRGQLSTLNLTIQTCGNVSSVNTQAVCCEQIGSLVSTLREFRALSLLQKSKMLLPVLKPDIKFYAPCQDGQPERDMPEYNADQAKAISCGFAMVKRKLTSPKILLIHGPPGTGKSKIIVGILHSLLPDAKKSPPVPRSTNSRMRILLCAPSNAAIDSLTKKVIVAFKEKCLDKRFPQGNCGDIKLVRLGSEKTISENLKLFSLDSQVKKGLEKAHQKADSDIHRKMAELDKTIEELSHQCAKTDKKSALFEHLNEKKQLHSNERRALSQQLKEFRGRKQAMQSRILCEAHVICCTLSTSGSNLLESAFRRLGHEPFSCVIVDEAGQAKETETLIPLLYRCQNLILVGDPRQLPPTVKSQDAKERKYDQSLMARAWKSLHSQNTHSSASIYLRVQYRMHPDICEFPSKYIYKNDLKTDPETAQKLCSFSWLFEPYKVFDVTDGIESKERDSFINLKEVELVVLLYKKLWEKLSSREEKQPIRVGIITPYNAQKQRILQAIEPLKELPKYIHDQVDTVDGFQGREMDCIIVSCVRASNESNSIGFVANLQRMNVTITRAKYSLFILGHLHTLKDNNDDWGALVKDAERRGAIVTVNESNFHNVTNMVLKQIRLSRSQSHPSTHMSNAAGPDRPRDPRMHARPSDPRTSAAFHVNREQDCMNQSFTRPGPSGRRDSEPRLDQGATGSFHLTSTRHRESHFTAHRAHKN